MNINWIYVTKESRPEIGEIILCDLGKEKPFMIARYLENGVEDINTNKRYSFNFEVHHWAKIGKHFDEQ